MQKWNRFLACACLEIEFTTLWDQKISKMVQKSDFQWVVIRGDSTFSVLIRWLWSRSTNKKKLHLFKIRSIKVWKKCKRPKRLKWKQFLLLNWAWSFAKVQLLIIFPGLIKIHWILVPFWSTQQELLYVLCT